MAADWNPTVLNPTRWLFASRCSCGGTDKWHYRHRSNAATDLYIFPMRDFFRLFQNGKVIYERPLVNLHETLLSI